jgi:hypothetical protein
MSGVEIFGMRLYQFLRRRGISHMLAGKAQRIAIEIKTRDVASWRTFGMGRLIDIGLTAHEASTIRSVFILDAPKQDVEKGNDDDNAIRVSEPHNVQEVWRPKTMEDVNRHNAEVAAGTRPGPMVK